MGRSTRGTWLDQQITEDGRIDHEDPLVREVAEMLHRNESMHLHDYIAAPICAYCALRTSRILRWAREIASGEGPHHDTPFGLIRAESSTPAAEGRQE